MKKKKTNRHASAKPYRRLAVIGVIVALGCLAVAAATRASRHRSAKEAASAQKETQNEAAKAWRNYVTVKVAGRNVEVDPQTGQIKPLTPQEAKQLAEGLKVMLNRSTEGLVQVQEPDGSVSMDLQGRFQNVAVAKVNQDGSVTRACIDNPQAAASFFGIDPQLLGIEPAKDEPAKQPARFEAVKSSRQ